VSDSTVEFTHRNNLKTPITTKSSVGAKKSAVITRSQARGVACMTSAKREKERRQ